MSDKARIEVSKVVGRDTACMGREDIIRAVIETLAENTSDGIIAPIFYYSLGGLPLAMAYKAINTLDSMIGYNNTKYKYFGRTAARLDDIANFFPARITGFGFCLATLFIGYGWKNCLKTMYRDARKHPSWNAGYPEAAVAGAMGIRLGGLNYYNGKKSFRAYMGEKKHKLITNNIDTIVKLIYLNTCIFVIVLFFINNII
jgi:adenosylcobinamide-phosphate synthase